MWTINIYICNLLSTTVSFYLFFQILLSFICYLVAVIDRRSLSLISSICCLLPVLYYMLHTYKSFCGNPPWNVEVRLWLLLHVELLYS